MTLLDLCRLIKHYWYVLVITLVVCVLACGAFMLVKERPSEESFTAKSTIVVNSQASTVVGCAQILADLAKVDNPNVKVTAAVSSGTTNVVVTVVANDEHLATVLAESIANGAVEQTQEIFATNEGSEYKTQFDAVILDTTVQDQEQEAQSSSGLIKYLLIAALAGLFIGVCIVIAINYIRHPVISIYNIQEVTELPVLECMPFYDDGSRLLANIRFAAQQNNLESICILPIGDNELSERIREALEGVFRADKGENDALDISIYDSLEMNMKGAYAAQKAQATVLVVQQWEDSLKQLESTMAELILAQANVVGSVFASAK